MLCLITYCVLWARPMTSKPCSWKNRAEYWADYEPRAAIVQSDVLLLDGSWYDMMTYISWICLHIEPVLVGQHSSPIDRPRLRWGPSCPSPSGRASSLSSRGTAWLTAVLDITLGKRDARPPRSLACTWTFGTAPRMLLRLGELLRSYTGLTGHVDVFWMFCRCQIT